VKSPAAKRDFWFWTTLGIAGLFIVFLVYPLFSLFASSFVDPESGGFTLANYAQFFRKKFYYRALYNSMSVTACVTLLAVLIGAPMAYLTSAFVIRSKKTPHIPPLVEPPDNVPTQATHPPLFLFPFNLPRWGRPFLPAGCRKPR